MPWLDIRGLPTFDVSSVKYVLAHVNARETNLSSSDFTTRQRFINGTLKTVYSLCTDDTTVDYVNVDYVSMYDRTVVKIVGATLIGNLRHEFTNDASVTMYHRLSKTRPVNDLSYTYSLKKDNQKITQTHHQHVRLCDLFDVTSSQETILLTGYMAELASALDAYNNIESTHATFLTYLGALPDKDAAIFIGLLRHYKTLQPSWLKKEGIFSKQVQGMPGNELSKLFELNVLVNRLETEVQWENERANRTQPRYADVPADIVFKHCVQLFSDAKIEGKRAYRYTFKDYWRQRVVLMPGGSVHSNITSDMTTAKNLDRKLRTKKGFFASMTNGDHLSWVSRPREIHAYTSTKYEWGKTRALYGCDVTSHIHADFSLNKCEETFPSYIPTGSKATSHYVSEIAKNLRHMIPFCYDYDDFNSQHSTTSMRAVMMAWLYTFGGNLSDEQRSSLMWTVGSLESMFVHQHIDGEVYRAAGTLFSGWRLTTFINTALNYAYLAAAGMTTIMCHSLHNGDDVLASARNIGEIVDVIRGTKKYNIRAQTTKMNIGTIAEFLRMDLNAVDMTSKQYLTRACATLVHSRIESGSPMSYRAVVTSIATRCDEVIARGGCDKLIDRLGARQYQHAARMFGCAELSKEITTYDTVAGGTCSNGVIQHNELVDTEIPSDDDVNMSLITPGINDYITYICDKMPMMRKRASNVQLEKTLRMTFNVKRSMTSKVESSKRDLMLWKSLKGIWRSTLRIGAFSKARMTSADMLMSLAAVSPVHAAALQKTDNPDRKSVV